MPAIPVMINGKNYAWSNISLILFGIPLIGITSIDYSRKKKSDNNYGAGSEPVSYGDGNYEYSGSITVYVDEIRNIQRTAPNFSILDIPPFTIPVMYSGDGVVFATDKLKNVRFLEDNFSSKQNDTSITVTIPFALAGIEKS